VKDRDCRVESCSFECPGICRIGFSCPALVEEAGPGQFVMVEVSDGPLPAARRPFTLSSVSKSKGIFEIVFEVKGPGTSSLASSAPGRSCRVMGPLGRGYETSADRWLLVGGGLGAAGFPFLAASVRSARVLLGASCSDALVRTGGEAEYATEDGSAGRRGLVTDLLDGLDLASFDAIAVCGPTPMMKAVVEAVPDDLRPRVQVSLESRMGCGWGACGGCAIPASAGGYLKCCVDGPVVTAQAVDWSRMGGGLV